MSLNILNNADLAIHTSWLVGGKADYLVFPNNTEELKTAIIEAQKQAWPITVISGGSNVLVSDKGIRGLTICLRKFSQISSEVCDGRLYVNALSGTAKSELLKIFLKHKLVPALFLAGLPGDIGGGVAMNAGVSEKVEPREFMEIVDEITVIDFDGNEKIYRKEDLDISYRSVKGWQPGVIASVKISCPYEPDDTVITKVREANKVRLTKQPLDKPSCGSVFKNPLPQTSGQLIDSCGLKGFQMGGAQVSLKHANFIINTGHATAQDIWAVITHVQKTVKDKTGIDLKTEVVRLGDWP